KTVHGANRHGIKVPENLASLETKYGKCGREIYIALAKAYLAILCEDYVYEQQKAHLINNPTFESTINIPKKLNYKLVFDEKALEFNNYNLMNTDSDFLFSYNTYFYLVINSSSIILYIIFFNKLYTMK